MSVIIPSYRGVEHVGRCLESLAKQTLSTALYELIIILNGPDDGTALVLDAFRTDNPHINMRTLRTTAQGAARARNAGILAAVREYTTFVDDDDFVSPRFLEVLLAHAAPGIVAISNIADVNSTGDVAFDNHINNAVVRHEGRVTAPFDIRAATTANAGKAVSTRLIKDLEYSTGLVSGEDVLFWTTVAVNRDIAFLPTPRSEDAVYYRVLRDQSISRRPMTFEFAVEQRLDVISKLDDLAQESDGPLRDLVVDRMSAQTDFIKRYLDQSPQDRNRVVRALDARNILHFPYARMNGSDDVHALTIAYAFPPYADTSAVVMAKRVRANAEVVDVIYNAMDTIRKQDNSLRRISGPFVARERALHTPSYFADFGSMQEFALAGLDVIAQWERSGRDYRWVYSRAQFAASHFLAAAYKASNPSVRWVAEFSDPLSRDIHNQLRGNPVTDGVLLQTLVASFKAKGMRPPQTDNSFVWCEEVAYAFADEIIFTNQHQLEYMVSYCSRPELVDLIAAKAVVSPQPTLPTEFYRMADHSYDVEEHFSHIAYFGNFYETRGLDEVLVAITRLDEHARHLVRLHVFTSKPDELQRRAAELGLSEHVVVGPYVDYLQFLALTTRFDCLLVNDAQTSSSHARNPFLPSKWSDYRGSDRPVWGLVEADSILSRQPLHHMSAVGDVDGAVEVLSRLVMAKASRSTATAPTTATGTEAAVASLNDTIVIGLDNPGIGVRKN